MIVLTAAITGALLGVFQAKRRNGNRKDIAQYAVVYAMVFALVALFVTIFLLRSSA